MSDLGESARRLLRHIGQTVDLKPYAWTDLPDGSDSAVAAELVEAGFAEPYQAGWRLTAQGCDYLLTTEEIDPDEFDPRPLLDEWGLSAAAADEIRRAAPPAD